MPCFFSAFQLRCKQLLLKISCVCLLIPSFSYANMPVIDVTAIGNMILQYNQMLEEAIKYEKELSKLGIDTGRVGGILGKLDALTSGALETLSALESLPGTLDSLLAGIKEDCDFLMKDKLFKDMADKFKDNSFADFVTGELKTQTMCLAAVNDSKAMSEVLGDKLAQAQQALKKGDLEKYDQTMQEYNAIHTKQAKINQQMTKDKRTQWNEFYAKYQTKSKDKNVRGYTKSYMNEQMKNLLEQASKAQTQTDFQNFTNQILIEILRVAQLNYEMMMNFNNTMIAMQDIDDNLDKKMAKNLEIDKQKLAENREQLGVFAKDSPFEDLKGEFKKDALGLPVLDFGKK
ncbi:MULTISPECIES: hypothetical protein [Helicobacter]|uniref:Uncharacterized protein n=3 Tax=Helicobacter TaxID=209 RepID=A0A377JL43_9HELI|nr:MULTISPECIES: hypothetical protein [Helicobacter]KAA8708177.1 hypothetical protein F4V45_06980 [Helicobacter canis]MDL0080962.1 hypothetical protein [Helicobacter sp. CPD2-1]MDL0082958.1 hypothetical protein [Helicobacter sp. XJK30-2]STP06492.1 Uncharacterised protein [Helicobacter canis]